MPIAHRRSPSFRTIAARALGKAGALPDTRLAPAAPLALADDDLALFVLNVGDGDALVLRFPFEGQPGGPSYGVIDSFDGVKTIALLDALGAGPIRFMCATHPHFDHISGLKKVLVRFQGTVSEFWDSGFRYTSATYRTLLEEVIRQAPALRLVRPTSGYEYFQGDARLTVLSPSISLRNRYDTYGVDVNNASMIIRIVYPVEAPSSEYPKTEGGKPPPAKPARTLILGGDAQTDAWGQVVQEFPHLDKDPKNWVRQIGAGTGAQPLACDFFKVSHHGSKRGVNLELVERLGDKSGGVGPSSGPRWMAVSSSTDEGSGYGFPHAVTQELLREVRDPKATGTGDHRPDDELGIHYTSQRVSPEPPGEAGSLGPAGSMAYVVHGDGSADMYRFGDGVDDPVTLATARRVK
jgi:beta-lactamase superfamily II metal-dependent hydrolase